MTPGTAARGRAHRLLADRPLVGRNAIELRDLLRGMVERAGLDYIVGILPVSARSFAHIR